MKIRKHILIIVILLALFSSQARAQYVAEVCAGDTGVSFMVQGWENSTFNWTIEGGVITRDYGDSIIVDWPVAPGEYQVTVQEISEAGCAGDIQAGMVRVSGPEVSLGGDQGICIGNTFTLAPEGNYASYLWHDGSTGSRYTTDMEEWIKLLVKDEYGCSAIDSMYLTVSELPYIDLGPDTSLCGDQSLELDAGNDGIVYLWSTGDNTQRITVFAGFQEIWVDVENAYGCTNRDEIIIEECDFESFFKGIPTAITPNGDGTNDVWNLYRLEAYPEAVVEIFDRWGTLVWRSEPGYSVPWDGRTTGGNMVPMDSYHFVIKFNTVGDDRIVGIVTVIK